jgi:predicted MFS family arabinose efflux permease
VHDRTLRQTAVDAPWLARVDAGIRSIGQGATLAGAAVGGVVGTALGARSVLVLSAAALGAAALLALMTLARRVR